MFAIANTDLSFASVQRTFAANSCSVLQTEQTENKTFGLFAGLNGHLVIMCQQPYEEAEVFILRFWEAMTDAYPGYELGCNNLHDMLKQSYVRGLKSDNHDWKLASHHDVKTPLMTPSCGPATCHADKLYTPNTRQVERMDMDAMSPSRKKGHWIPSASSWRISRPGSRTWRLRKR